MRRLILIAVLLCLTGVGRTTNAELVDHIIAAVNQEVITSSDLAHTVALNMRLGNSKDTKTLESETLDGLINRRLLVQEARRLRFVEVSDQDISTEREKLIQKLGSDRALADFLSAQNMTEQEVGRMLGEQLLVERFVEKKVGLFVRVTREQALKFFDEQSALYKGRSFQDVQKIIYGILTQRKIEQQLDQYVAELRSKADIRINIR